jgi:hypothetical protein
MQLAIISTFPGVSHENKLLSADPCDCAVEDIDLRPLACDWGFESYRGHGCLSVVCVLRFQVEVFATS